MTQHLNQHLPRMINHQTIGLWDDDGNFLHLTKIYTTTRLPAGDCPMDFGIEEEPDILHELFGYTKEQAKVLRSYLFKVMAKK